MTTKEKDLLGLAQATSHYSAQVAEKYQEWSKDIIHLTSSLEGQELSLKQKADSLQQIEKSLWQLGIDIQTLTSDYYFKTMASLQPQLIEWLSQGSEIVNGLKELGYPMQSAEEMAEIFQKLGLNSSTKVH